GAGTAGARAWPRGRIRAGCAHPAGALTGLTRTSLQPYSRAGEGADVMPNPLTNLGQQLRHHALRLRSIAAAKQVGMVENVVEIVERPAHRIAGVERPGRAVRRIKARRETAEQFAHREIAFTV